MKRFTRRSGIFAEPLTSTPYRGAAGLRDRFYLAELDEDQQVIRRVSPYYGDQVSAVIAWSSRRDRRTRLVREISIREIVA